MLVISVLALVFSALAALAFLRVREEAAKVSLACLSILGTLCTLLLAPWFLKLSLALIPFALERFYRSSLFLD